MPWGSTGQILQAAGERANKRFIVATDIGLFHRLEQSHPEKTFIQAPTGAEASSKCGGHCPWMAMNELPQLADCLRDPASMAANEIDFKPDIRECALLPLQRMLAFQG